jgi:hypothetical protein
MSLGVFVDSTINHHLAGRLDSVLSITKSCLQMKQRHVTVLSKSLHLDAEEGKPGSVQSRVRGPKQYPKKKEKRKREKTKGNEFDFVGEKTMSVHLTIACRWCSVCAPHPWPWYPLAPPVLFLPFLFLWQPTNA